MAEYWYNTAFHSSINTTPFQILNGQPPPLHLPYIPGESKVEVVDRILQDREAALALLKHLPWHSYE